MNWNKAEYSVWGQLFHTHGSDTEKLIVKVTRPLLSALYDQTNVTFKSDEAVVIEEMNE